jgi:hypothetical protein
MPVGIARTATKSAGSVAASDINNSTDGTSLKWVVIFGRTGDTTIFAMIANHEVATKIQPTNNDGSFCLCNDPLLISYPSEQL